MYYNTRFDVYTIDKSCHIVVNFQNPQHKEAEMQELIKIEKRVIGAEDTNSVNAEDIHKYLEVKTRFDTWIGRAIKKYDFLENIDYIVMLKNEHNPKGGPRAKEYIVTLDMAKELSMLENNAKGKETRKYFISMEKQALMQTPNAEQLAPVLQAISKQQELLINAMKVMAENQAQQHKDIQELKKAQLLAKPRYEHTTLTAKHMDKINAAIRNAAVHVAEFHKLSVPTATRVLYGELNGRMGVSTYYQILEKDFLRAMVFIKSTGEKAKLENENINEILSNSVSKVLNEYDEDALYDDPMEEE